MAWCWSASGHSPGSPASRARPWASCAMGRFAMAAGLEGREPLLDHRLVELAMRLPLSMRRGELGTKHLVRRILYRHVPRELIDRPKQGFAIPLGRWLRGELAHLLDEYLDPRRV